MERVLHSATSQLPEEVQSLLGALEAIPAGIVVADLKGSIIYVNQRVLDSLGYVPEEILGKPVSTLHGDSMSPTDFLKVRARTRKPGGWRGEVRHFRKDGSSFPVFIETATIRNKKGEAVVAVAVARDISEQRAFQDRMVAEAQQGTFGVITHNVAHEVRNHLSAIKMSLYMLESTDTPVSDRPTHFSIAKEEIDRIELFVRTLDTYANPPRPVFDRFSLVDVVNRGLEDARPFIHRKSVTLFRQFPGNSPTLLLDRDQLARAVCEVVENACNAVTDNGEIHVNIKRQPRADGITWLVELRDNGPGVPLHLVGRVFEPFFTTTKARLGLGLRNVARILNLHGGEATLSSNPGRGTAVILKIPETPDGEEEHEVTPAHH